MFLKILVYSVAIWLFIKVTRRAIRILLGVEQKKSSDSHINHRSTASRLKRIDDVEEAVFTEIDDKH